MGNAAQRRQPFVVALLVAVVDRVAWEDAVTVMLIGTHDAHACVGRKKLWPPFFDWLKYVSVIKREPLVSLRVS